MKKYWHTLTQEERKELKDELHNWLCNQGKLKNYGYEYKHFQRLIRKKATFTKRLKVNGVNTYNNYGIYGRLYYDTEKNNFYYITGQSWNEEYITLLDILSEPMPDYSNNAHLKTKRNLTVTEMRSLNSDAGFHFFDKETMKFFSSRVHGTCDRFGYFITSEKNFDGTKRLYTIRQFDFTTFNVHDITDFNAITTLDYAREYVKDLRKDARQN